MSLQDHNQAPCDPQRIDRLPDWVPHGARLYLSHIAAGMSLRALARQHGCHASTILRQVRRLENRRDDPLVDDALSRLDEALRCPDPARPEQELAMTAAPPPRLLPTRMPGGQAPAGRAPARIEAEIRAVLQTLDTPGAVLVVAPDMPKAVIITETREGRTERLAVLDRHMAETLALRDWITCHKPGRVSCYVLSDDGSAALAGQGGTGLPKPPPAGGRDNTPARLRHGGGESPIAILARRRDKSGQTFLRPDDVSAADRMHEDFIMAGLEGMPLHSAEAFVVALEARKLPPGNVARPGTRAARLRVIAALRELGPGLADIVLRCCCFQQGVEAAEAELGWSARSGKIVLRIALQRLARHCAHQGEAHMLIG
ncbi:MAG: helix-turn-helix domain-containing protein [Rhodobacteraceae bacterium]|nr:helix-turn-helix domain-containing protein [Paracoccaceae bacterium]